MTAVKVPPDQEARDAATKELETNFLVEAGAGSGKTTLLAARMAALVESGVPTARIAAVTFTRKASGELRERFQLALEDSLVRARDKGDEKLHGLLDAALDSLDDAFLGTIHSFCARLLRERPIEARLDPGFQELEEDASAALREEWWARWLERCHFGDDPELRQLLDVGIEPEQLSSAFATFDRYPDVDFSAGAVPAPDVSACRRALEKLLDRAITLVPRERPDPDWDKLQLTVKRLWYERNDAEWNTTVGFCDALTLVGSCDVTQKRWVRPGDDPATAKREAKELGEAFAAFAANQGALVLATWRAHRYPFVVSFLRRAATEFAEARVAQGRLGFEDLLVRAADLLTRDSDARRTLGERFRRVLVDEFQDTDPVQARVLFLLASDPKDDARTGDWTSVKLRDGALFVVGDPKQSIYRFRRADIETYATAKDIVSRQGRVLTLEANFRSVRSIAGFVNEHFGAGRVFPEAQTPQQARFAPMLPMRGEGKGSGVFVYDLVGDKANPSKGAILALDAPRVASWIAAQVASGHRQPQDFLVLARRKEALAAYARALAAHNVPVSVTGADTEYEAELQEVELVLRLLADPSNSVLTAAALEGVFVGATPADLWSAREAGLSFQVAEPPPPAGPDDSERVRRVRTGLAVLHHWLTCGRHAAPDELLETILDESGLLVLTAAGDLGDARAGMLLELVSQVRSATLADEQGPAAAVRALERLSTAEAPDASLRPGRTDAVRVMNLHKAKGLEAPVVVLAAPWFEEDHPPKVAVRREGMRAVGGVLVRNMSSREKEVLAHPLNWTELAAAEQSFLDAEVNRLLYVASTRAKEELVVSRLWGTPSKKPPQLAEGTAWSALNSTLEVRATLLKMEPTDPPGRDLLQRSGSEIAGDARKTDEARAAASKPTYSLTTVSRSAKGEREEILEVGPKDGVSAGAAWGRAVHRVIQWMGEHRDRAGLPAAVHSIAADEELVAPYDAAALLQLVERLQRLDEWRAIDAAEERVFEWPVAEWRAGRDGMMELVEGVIDAAYKAHEGWVVVDWKTDASDVAWSSREAQYRDQVEQYAAVLARATGVPARGQLVRLTNRD
jgi:ATP-dependent helicase/nuclease subunit A